MLGRNHLDARCLDGLSWAGRLLHLPWLLWLAHSGWLIWMNGLFKFGWVGLSSFLSPAVSTQYSASKPQCNPFCEILTSKSSESGLVSR